MYFRITICIRRGVKVRITGMFDDGTKARAKTLADYPNAAVITVMCIRGEVANA